MAASLANDIIDSMASLIIRKLDDRTKSKLRMQAAHHGRSMEEEAREILRSALSRRGVRSENIGQAIRRRFSALGGVDLDLPERAPIPAPPSFEA